MSSRPQEKSQNPKPKKDKENKEKEKEEEIIEERISSLNGELQVRQYLKQKHLGKGAFASVFEIQDLETQEKFAAKIISKDLLRKNQSHHKVLNEVQIHKSMSHPNIVKFERVFEDRQNVYIIVELCSKNTLRKFIKKSKRLPELDAQHYLYQIIYGLQHIHANGVVHRDLKLGNLFLTKDMQIKIGDFGLANKSGPDMERRRTVCGTPNYVAPEILSKSGHSFEADIWSLGVIAYTMLVGYAPFETTDVKVTYKKIQKGEYNFPANLCLSECAKDFVSKILVVNPSKRLTIEQILNHPFMKTRGEIPDALPISVSKDWSQAKFMDVFKPKCPPKKPAPIESPEASENVAASRISSEPQKEFKAFKPYIPAKAKQSFTPTYRKQSFKPISTIKKPASSPEKISSSATVKKGWLPTLRKPLTNASIKRESPLTLRESPIPMKDSQIILPSNPDVHITNWLEYPKYGVGYQLSNNQIGILFNDSTKIIMNPSFMTFEYIKKEQENPEDDNATHDLSKYPKELEKKVACLQRFLAFFNIEPLDQAQPKSGIKKSASSAIINLERRAGPNSMVYVKKLIKAQDIVIFRLSNQTLQVIFTDGISIIVNHPRQLVTYIDKEGSKCQFNINYVATCDNEDVIKRLKQMQEILKQVREVEKGRENSLNHN